MRDFHQIPLACTKVQAHNKETTDCNSSKLHRFLGKTKAKAYSLSSNYQHEIKCG